MQELNEIEQLLSEWVLQVVLGAGTKDPVKNEN